MKPGKAAPLSDWAIDDFLFPPPQQLPRFRLVLSHFRPYMGFQRLMGPGLVMLAADSC